MRLMSSFACIISVSWPPASVDANSGSPSAKRLATVYSDIFFNKYNLYNDFDVSL